MEQALRSRIEQALVALSGPAPRSRSPNSKSAVDDALCQAARELLNRALRCAKTELPAASIDRASLEAACFALQLPFGTRESTRQASMGVLSISDRCGQAAELLISLAPDESPLLDAATRILSECPRRSTTLAEARILADAVNLEDFGIAGICRSAALIVRPGGTLSQLADAFQKRESYGYWDARLKDGFHFPSMRDLARARLQDARASIQKLADEVQFDI